MKAWKNESMEFKMKTRRKKLLRVIPVLFIVFLVTVLFFLRQPKHPVRIYLIRHGQTESNVKGLLVGGGGNYPLTETGISAAVDKGRSLKNIRFDSVYTSTLGRTYDTAVHILEGMGQKNLKITQLRELDDIFWGEAEGYSPQDFLKKRGYDVFPDAFGDAKDSAFLSPIGAESKYSFCQRFDKGMQLIADKSHSGETILVVAHSSMQFWLQDEYPDTPIPDIPNLGEIVLEYNGGKWMIAQ